MKKFFLIACVLAAVVWAVTMPLACGPQKPFCPNTKTGDCVETPPPQDGAGGGITGDSIFLEV